ALKKYFAELYDTYYTASKIRSLYKKIDAPAEAECKFQDGVSLFKTRGELNTELARLNKIAETAEKKISDMRQDAEKDKASPLSRVVLRMTDKKTNPPPPRQRDSDSEETKIFSMSGWSRNKRKFYSSIKDIILGNPKLGGEALVRKIQEELAK
ncbi:MAG: hypothetical protein IJR52_05500, partial [Selenomonadaceae bacterium]|nr:hypothetical protein [Selenomonadaceae bacterium]